MGELAGAAQFWVMRSCEYAKVPKAEQRQMKQLVCIRNIVFIKDGESTDHKSPSLHLADCVSVTFERQKNDRKADTVTQWRTSDEFLCPVKIWASLIRRISSYKGASKDSPVSFVQYKDKVINITGEMITDLYRDGVVAIGETKLGIRKSEIGTRSIRSGAAGHVPRWSSSILDHVNQKMVEHSLPQIHTKASTRVFTRHLLENDRSSVFQARPKPNRIEPDGEHCWQLVSVADGLNWWRKHHRRKDGGGDEPIKNWSQPQPSS